MSETVGILHPGSMGGAVAACAATNATAVLWCENGRSTASVTRAAQFGLTPVATLAELLDRSGIVISPCPPAAAAGLPAEMLRATASTVARWHGVKDDSELTLTDALDQLPHP
ncbi:hypothetical protein DV517_74920 [Streptomyces sp. S816]|uniref:hypothetical protein n=1 Tax=Streptomyces sp. S816 TaxID=2283197 RepID=UPI0011397172|nr:hypothetical protein [Streptomyces sp. S816]TGZ12397.1 hypothetical protein DV517_74920 [Streptomyces sp. S816]